MKYFFLTILILGASIAYAKQVSVDVLDPSIKSIKAEVTNIQAGTQIDITLPPTASEQAVARTSFGLTDKEVTVQEAVMTGALIDPNDIGAYVSGMQKMHDKRGVSGDETNELLLKNKSAKEVGTYFHKKEVLEQ